MVTIRFGPFTLDFDTRQLTRAGHEIHLAPKAFELLTALALERPHVLSKAVLQERLWPGTFVAEAMTSPAGAYSTTGLNDGSYYAKTSQFLGYVDELYNAINAELASKAVFVSLPSRRVTS